MHASIYLYIHIHGAREQRAVLADLLVHVDDLGAGEELHDKARGDDRRDAELHERAAVRREDDAHPVERVGAVVRLDPVQRNLRSIRKLVSASPQTWCMDPSPLRAQEKRESAREDGLGWPLAAKGSRGARSFVRHARHATRCNAMRCDAMQCGAMRCDALQTTK